jgi:hypothetical protein
MEDRPSRDEAVCGAVRQSPRLCASALKAVLAANTAFNAEAQSRGDVSISAQAARIEWRWWLTLDVMSADPELRSSLVTI